MPATRVLTAALALVLIAAVPARATSVPTLTVVDSIRPGPDSSYALDVSTAVALGDYLYFQANDGTNGYELWRTNGTTTTLVEDIRTGADSSDPYGFTAFGDYLYFRADDGTNSYELWRTNGTTTTLVEDIRTGADTSYPYGFTAFGDYLYFRADDGTNGTELWRTNGTVTERVPFPIVGAQYINCNCYETSIVAVGGRLFTTVDSDAIGDEFAYLDEPTYRLPGTNRGASIWTTTLVILAGLTAAAGIGLRMRGATRT